MNRGILDKVLFAIVIAGAFNWGLIGFFRFDLISFLFGNMTWLSRTAEALIGISGLYTISAFRQMRMKS